jgi:His-Xaa-Ser system protein HxsD
MDFKIGLSNNERAFRFDTRAYHKEALYGAALVVTKQCYAYLEKTGFSFLRVTLRAKEVLGEEGLKRLAGEFHNELLSQTLRWMVAKQNKKVREAIVTQALYAARGGSPAQEPARRMSPRKTAA